MSIPNNNHPKSMRSVLKGLRFISTIFDNENKESAKIHIGNPTDVKHVAHIGWDGNNDGAPTWMTGFKEQPSPNGTSSLQSIPEEPDQKSQTASSSRGSGGLPRRQASSAAREPANKHNGQTRKATRNGNKEAQLDGEAKPSTEQSISKEGVDHDGQKKLRRKKAKESDRAKSKPKAVDDQAESSSSQPDQSHTSSSVEEER